MFSQIGPLEIGLVLIIALVILGPKKLPDMGRSLGKGMREFKESIAGEDHRDEQLTAATAAEQAPAPAPRQQTTAS
jgi:sec-independent protein translocase protein TatA